VRRDDTGEYGPVALDLSALPDEVRALIATATIARPQAQLTELRRMHFGRASEGLDAVIAQLELSMGDRQPDRLTALPLRARFGRQQADARRISVGEFDPTSLQRSAHRINRPLPQFLTALEASDRIRRYLGGLRQLAHTKPKGRPCHFALHGGNHNRVTIPIADLGYRCYRNRVLISEQEKEDRARRFRA
jgi:hypothetical protein